MTDLMREQGSDHGPANLGCLLIFIIMGVIGFHAGTTHELESSGLRAFIGGILGLFLGLLVIFDD